MNSIFYFMKYLQTKLTYFLQMKRFTFYNERETNKDIFSTSHFRKK